MAKAKWTGEGIYAAATRFKSDCLLSEGSLFTPGETVWTSSGCEELESRVAIEDLGEGSFIDKLDAQLDGLPPERAHLAAEMLFVLLLPEYDVSAAKKREHIERILSLVPSGVTIPPDLDEALEGGGVATFGAAKANRDAYLRFLARLVVRTKSMDPDERTRILSDAWSFRELVEEVRTSADAMAANAVLHMVFPDEFEYMISEAHRKKLIDAFGDAPGVADEENTDRKIARIRELATAGGDDIDLYEDPFQRVWKESAPARWEEAVAWAIRLYTHQDFDRRERTYKLKVAGRLAEARAALASADPDWPMVLRGAFRDNKNNLTDWRQHDPFVSWCVANAEKAGEALGHLWRGESPDASTIRAFLDVLPREAVSGTGTRLSIASFLLLGVNPVDHPFYKPSVHSAFQKVVGVEVTEDIELDSETMYRPEDLAARLGLDGKRVRAFLRERFPREDSEHGSDWYLTADQAQGVLDEFAGDVDVEAPEARYADWRMLLEELRLRMLATGTPLRDLLDAQGLAWWLAKAPPPDDWSDEDKAAFEVFRSGGSSPPAPGDEVTKPMSSETTLLPTPSAELASKLHLPLAWLERLFGLLEEKKQLILYGPPGTGKTFIAQRVREHLQAHGGASRLVQFHPSYTYEDFFEGYRPTQHGDGALTFKLVPGALREIAASAAADPDKPHLLVIDEINRGNIAKIFGELYFLLEYRDQAIQLQYSRGEEFRLPPNLYVLGTMNTADRSIALVDSALRRRFFFLGLIPTHEPVIRVLKDWLAGNNLEPEPAVLLNELNRAIDDEDFAIGPSYFMKQDGSQPDLERVWAHSIMPLLEERFYGSDRDIEAEFGLAAIRKRVAEAADAVDEDGDSSDPSA